METSDGPIDVRTKYRRYLDSLVEKENAVDFREFVHQLVQYGGMSGAAAAVPAAPQSQSAAEPVRFVAALPASAPSSLWRPVVAGARTPLWAVELSAACVIESPAGPVVDGMSSALLRRKAPLWRVQRAASLVHPAPQRLFTAGPAHAPLPVPVPAAAAAAVPPRVTRSVRQESAAGEAGPAHATAFHAVVPHSSPPASPAHGPAAEPESALDASRKRRAEDGPGVGAAAVARPTRIRVGR
jgi:hypothetical protein